ncbi:MAG: type III-B CRISPR module RAMP protein Cmr6 [Candidatus Micrarchaeia archaeon]
MVKAENLFSWLMIRSIEFNKMRAKNEDTEKVNEYKLEILESFINKLNRESIERIKFVQKLVDSAKAALAKNCIFVIDIEAKTVSRLLVNTASGLGRTVFEVGLAFNPILNLPYIPSSSIKGSLRNYIHFDEKSKEFIFGDQKEAGYLIVLDSYPSYFSNNLLEAEVTTSIYGEEIEENKAKPNPIIYPCIARGVTFRFVLGISNRIDEETGKQLRNDLISYFLKMAKYGLGAKTLLGYGELERVNTIG